MENAKFGGKKGGENHQLIEQILRTKVIPLLRERGYLNSAIFFLEKMWDLRLGYDYKGDKYPDAIICSRYVPYEYFKGTPYKDEMILIEIGNYVPSKWPLYSVIHIGFNKEVTGIFKSDSEFKLHTLKAIEEVLAPDINCNFDGLSLSDLRLLTQYVLIGIGLTSTQFDLITIDNLDLSNDLITLAISGETLVFNEDSSLIIKKYIEQRKINGETINNQSHLLGANRENKDNKVGPRTLQRDLQEHMKTIKLP